MNDLFSHLAARGYQIEGVSLPKWREQATLHADHNNALYPILSYYLSDTSDGDVIAPDYGNVVVDNTHALLQAKGMSFPQPEQFIHHLIEYLELVNFFGEHHVQL
ncbi:hypothetical protein D3C84_1117260 [compost metagenome]